MSSRSAHKTIGGMIFGAAERLFAHVADGLHDRRRLATVEQGHALITAERPNNFARLLPQIDK